MAVMKCIGRLEKRIFSPKRFAAYANYMRAGVENMRKLVYAFYDPNFSFKAGH